MAVGRVATWIKDFTLFGGMWLGVGSIIYYQQWPYVFNIMPVFVNYAHFSKNIRRNMPVLFTLYLVKTA